MKKLNRLVVTATIALLTNATLALQAGGISPEARLTTNAALLHSPRYLEEHPELLRPLEREKVKVRETDPLAKLMRNSAVASSPRFREEHAELLYTASPPVQRTAIAERERLVKLTENKASANSPRFREEHPEILRGEPEFEIAPLK